MSTEQRREVMQLVTKCIFEDLANTKYQSIALHYGNKIYDAYIKGSYPVVIADVLQSAGYPDATLEVVCETIVDCIRRGLLSTKGNMPNPITGAVLVQSALQWDLELRTDNYTGNVKQVISVPKGSGVSEIDIRDKMAKRYAQLLSANNAG